MKVLVVIDMQNDFISGSLGTPEAVQIVPNVVEKIRSWDGLIYATQDTHFANYLETQEGRILPVPHCIQGTDGWKVAPSVRRALTEGAARNESVLYITKATFGSRDLAEVLAKRHSEEPVEEIVLIGLCTDICVISNALVLKAFLPDVSIAVDAACCAGVNPQSHLNALEAMKMCQIKIYNE
ncbi:MAG: cysteine hydrolase [Oscillospiraceae bacterium]|nr:cysteine hydrolase [Oscillospiraceae bacterium]